MAREEPYFRKCCFCLPLKACLLTWAYIKVSLDIMLTMVLTFVLMLLTMNHSIGYSFKQLSVVHFLLMITIVLIVDIAFKLVLIIGLSKKNLQSLNVFFYYSIYMVLMNAGLIVGIILMPIICPYVFGFDLTFGFILAGALVNTSLDVCIMLTLKSEMIKLRNKKQYEFVMMPALKQEGSELDTEEVDLNV